MNKKEQYCSKNKKKKGYSKSFTICFFFSSSGPAIKLLI